jgi:hypothetical protein
VEGKEFGNNASGFVFNRVNVFREKELGIELENKVSDMWTLRDNSVLELEWVGVARRLVNNIGSFVDVYTKFPFCEVSV